MPSFAYAKPPLKEFMSYTVRLPKMEDYDQINDLGRWFQENSIYENCAWSPKKCHAMLVNCVEKQNPMFLRVVEKDNEIVGFFLGILTEYFFSTKKIANELVVIFKEDHRDGIAKPIIKMLIDFETWAKKHGAHEINVGIVSGIAGSGYSKLLTRYGLKEVGQIYKKKQV